MVRVSSSDFAYQRLSDDITLNLTGTLIDREDAGVTHQFFQRILLGIAVAAVNLLGLEADVQHRLRDKALGAGAHQGVINSLVHQSGRIGQLGLAALQLHLHVRQLELNALQLADGLAEGETGPGVFDGQIQRPLSHAHRRCHTGRTGPRKHLHQGLEARALGTDHMVSGDTHLVKDHVSGVGATDAHLVLMLAHGHAGSVPFHDEQGDAVLALGGVCGAGHGIQVGHTAVGDEGLAAGDDILIAVLDSLGLAVAGIGAGLRLGDTHSPESTFSQADETFLLKLNKIIQENLDNSQLDIPFICKEIGMSRASLYNKLKALTDMGANDYINKFRMEKAIAYITGTDMTFTEIAEKVGFTTSRYFSTAFKQYTGETPTQYKEKRKK